MSNYYFPNFSYLLLPMGTDKCFAFNVKYGRLQTGFNSVPSSILELLGSENVLYMLTRTEIHSEVCRISKNRHLQLSLAILIASIFPVHVVCIF